MNLYSYIVLFLLETEDWHIIDDFADFFIFIIYVHTDTDRGAHG